MWVRVFLLFFSILLMTPSRADAHQTAVIIVEQAQVYSSPSVVSSVQVALSKGTVIPASSKMIQNLEGSYWYKVMFAKGQYGYVLANEVAPSDLKLDVKSAGFSPLDEDPIPHAAPWFFLLRGMALSGTSLSPMSLQFGGEVEGSVCLPLSSHGYLHRMISLGAAYANFSNQQILAGSVIFRLYQSTRLEPEFRLRLGPNLSSGALNAGVSFGASYPFSLHPGAHVSGYFEIGSLTELSFSAGGLLVWGAAGLGLHF